MSQQQDTSATPGSQAVPASGNNVISFGAAAAAAQAATATPAPNTGGKKKRENPIKVWCDSAMRGAFGEFAAERLDNSTLVRRWNDAYWELMSENDGYARATDWMNRHFPDELSSSRARDCWKTLTGLLHQKRPMRADDPGHTVLPLLGGYLHITPQRSWLEAPDRKYGLTHQIQASAGVAHGQNFVPMAVPPTSLFGRYLATSLPDLEVRALVQEQCALSFLPNIYQQAAWWVGDGGAGKGTLSKLLLRFHSKSATLDLHKLADPHHLEPLVGATFVMVDEVEQKGRWAEKEWKSIISNDPVSVNPKHRPSFKYQSTAYWIICSNQEPLIRDDSDGVRRRLVVVPWPGSARARGASTPDLDRKIFEQEGTLFLGWIVEGLMRLLKRGGPLSGAALPEAVKAMSRQIHTDNDSMETWFEACEIVPASGVEHTKGEIYEAYCKYAEDAHLFVYERESFWKRFKRRPDIRNGGVREVRGRRGTERTQLIRGLAITPAEVASVKRDALLAQAEAEGRCTVVAGEDPFGMGVACQQREYRFTDAEQVELERLRVLGGLSA
ncbi:MAG: hypothetical protein FH747_12390 [Stenotrophomonas sp.]|uniref:DNA primase family protein n=1 Tax=Stenotrophomonas sp. TaxID=69392 RepID=UPI001354A495|nr:DUF5906 domain-containing protein [Stenotrophomonas sp.]MTI74436.1 hypothetical protein [Stenotrophomonas sp.]